MLRCVVLHRAGTVHLILPFRGIHLDLLPSLLKNLARMRKFSGDAFRLIIAPVSWDSDGSGVDVQERVREVVAAASAHLATKFPIDIAEPVPVEQQVRERERESVVNGGGWGWERRATD